MKETFLGVKKKYLTPAFFCCMIAQVIRVNEILKQTLLYDFYGELLTEHQKKIYEDVVYHDLSLTEIAAENGISRQGVHDMIRRCNRILQEYENKLHLVARFMRIRENVLKLEEMSGDTGLTREEIIKQIKELSSRILEEL